MNHLKVTLSSLLVWTLVLGLSTSIIGNMPLRQAFSQENKDKMQVLKLDQVNEIIKELIAARETNRFIMPLTHTYGLFSLEEAYQIQGSLAKQLVKKLGNVVGYKVAYASKAAQQQFGIDGPASGPFFQLQRIPNGSTINADSFMSLLMETEVAFTIGRRIDQPIKSVEALKPYVKWIHAAFDIGNNCFDSKQAKPVVADMVASGTAAYFFILGPAMDPGEVDVDKITLKLAVNGKMHAESKATEVMGSPWNSLLWLANQVVHRGDTLEPGTVVLTGTAAPAYKAQDKGVAGIYVGDCGLLGRVTCTIR